MEKPRNSLENVAIEQKTEENAKSSKNSKTIAHIENFAASFFDRLVRSFIILQSQQFSSQIDDFGGIWKITSFQQKS